MSKYNYAGFTNDVDNSSSISDPSGTLLFYSDGMSVWNKNNALMSNGSGITSNFSAGQCALIVPIPSSNKYVVFSNTEFASPGQLHYSVVDMNLNSNLGDVIVGQKNISLGTGWTEKACAIYNCTGNYYWVVMHKWNTNQFVALKVDVNGVNTSSVVTSIGSNHNCGSYGAAHDAMGQLTISKDGLKVVNALTCQDKFELFDFDINTGILSNFISIPGNGGNAWGTGFSTDSKKLYVNSIFGQQVFQYDLSTYNTAAIVTSKTSLFTTGVGGYNFGYMELGPDNKMYIPRPGTTFFSVINSPNNLGAASSFSFTGLNVSPYTTTHGISRIAYNIGGSSGSGTISATSSNTNLLCFGSATASASITASGAGTFNYLWSPGNYTTASVSNLSAGIYTVSISNGGCITSTLTVNVAQPPVLTSTLTASSLTICKNDVVTLNMSVSGGAPSYTVNWNNGAVSPSIAITPSITAVYNYTVTDANSCIKTQSVQINVESTLAGFVNSIASCNSLISFTNTSTNNASTFWNFGDGQISNSNTITTNNYSLTGSYTVILISTTNIGCKDSIQKTLNINVNFLNLDFDYFVNEYKCLDSLFLVNKSVGGTSYSWDFGDGNTSVQISPSHVYSLGVYNVTLIGSNSNCIDTLTKEIIISDSNNSNVENAPNVFTPNNDGINDIFDFKTIAGCENFTVEIFDRWGLSILKNDKKQSFWDGRTTSGEAVTDGTYFYIMNMDSGNKLNGTVSVFR